MKTIIAVILAAFVFTIAPAAADTPRKVSTHEYSLVQPGWTSQRVNRLFDINGEWVSGEAGEWMHRMYPAVFGASVFVTYRKQDDGDWVVRRRSDGRTDKMWCDSLGCLIG